MCSRKLTLTALVTLLASSLLVSVDAASAVTPTEPGPGEVFTAGGQCSTSWDVATSSKWKNMTIDLMTGSNTNMVKLATVASGLDGTSSSTTSYSFTCPDVTIYSAIYFYQYTRGDNKDPTWTTRFTIQSADGTSTDPPSSTVSDGQTIYYGTGALAGSSSLASGSSGTAAGTAAATTYITATANGSSPTSANGTGTSDTTRMTTSTKPSTTSGSNSTATGSNSGATSTSGAAHTRVLASLTALFALGGAAFTLL